MQTHRSLILVMPSKPEGMRYQQYESGTQEGFLTELDFLPPENRAEFTPLLYPIEDYVADLMLLPGYRVDPRAALDTYRNDGVTHLAMLSLPNSDPATMRWGDKTFQLGFVVYYCAAHNKYRLIHCNACATCVREWLADMQEEWGQLYAVGGAVQKKGTPYN